MFKYEIDEIAKAILKQKGVDVTDVLEEYWDDKIAIVWTVEDIIEYAEDKDIKISEEEAKNILQEILSNQDSEIGVNWSVIDYHVNTL